MVVMVVVVVVMVVMVVVVSFLSMSSGTSSECELQWSSEGVRVRSLVSSREFLDAKKQLKERRREAWLKL
ncbi:hypothetical protein Pcinc_044346 [Petrolisthes cinctipes]|uniref:Uncharacterized protein n=1 Tax=Petrolisthes cinctipes TaxID=88211 RepID=A0AAE1BEF5_PETCI|nr:hypothetical protein Pcinc_044346 [Petrolisthes cinctipes]